MKDWQDVLSEGMISTDDALGQCSRDLHALYLRYLDIARQTRHPLAIEMQRVLLGVMESISQVSRGADPSVALQSFRAAAVRSLAQNGVLDLVPTAREAADSLVDHAREIVSDADGPRAGAMRMLSGYEPALLPDATVETAVALAMVRALRTGVGCPLGALDRPMDHENALDPIRRAARRMLFEVSSGGDDGPPLRAFVRAIARAYGVRPKSVENLFPAGERRRKREPLPKG